MSRRLHRVSTIVLALVLGGSVEASMHGDDMLATFPGQAAETGGLAGLDQEISGAGWFEDRNSPWLRLPLRAFGDEDSVLLYGPMLRYRATGTPDQGWLGGSGGGVLESGGFLAWRNGPWLLQGRTLGGNPWHGDPGVVGLTGSYALQGSERLVLIFSGSASYASEAYLQQRALEVPNLADPSLAVGGASGLGLDLNASYRLDSDWSLVGMFGVHHTLADEGTFPGVDDGPRFRAGAAFRYDF